MRRGTVKSPRRCAVPLSVIAVTLAAPATASGDVLSAFQKLADLRLSPTPLVPTTAPRLLRPIDETITASEGRRGYSIGMLGRRGPRVDRYLIVQGDAYPSMRAARRAFRGTGYRARPTSVRGVRGYLVTRRRNRALLWVEGGTVYFVGTTTSRTVPLAEVRATAAGLEPLGGSFVGSDESGYNHAQVMPTSRTATVDIGFSGECTLPDGSGTGLWDGQAYVSLLPRQGDSFAFEIGPNLVAERSSLRWEGTVSGTIGANGGTVNFRATGPGEDGASCDTGPLSLELRPTG